MSARQNIAYLKTPGQLICMENIGPRPASIASSHFDTFVLLCCWHLWKRRNGITFRQESMSLRQTLQACKNEARLWSCRLPCGERNIAAHWCFLFSLAM